MLVAIKRVDEDLIPFEDLVRCSVEMPPKQISRSRPHHRREHKVPCRPKRDRREISTSGVACDRSFESAPARKRLGATCSATIAHASDSSRCKVRQQKRIRTLRCNAGWLRCCQGGARIAARRAATLNHYRASHVERTSTDVNWPHARNR